MWDPVPVHVESRRHPTRKGEVRTANSTSERSVAQPDRGDGSGLAKGNTSTSIAREEDGKVDRFERGEEDVPTGEGQERNDTKATVVPTCSEKEWCIDRPPRVEEGKGNEPDSMHCSSRQKSKRSQRMKTG